ncbi:hypothetical protein BDY24DRAFT_341439 [Mrakia frigida]|uniref:uncharacterized protein n=1 Tax=Mrakia frigida TaxID=29902 RepID=UPI003FCBFAC2
MSSTPTVTHSILTLPQFSSVSPARLIVLYSDFGPQKGSNPPGFQANLVWWKSVLEAASEKAYFPSTEGAGGAIVIDVGDALVEALRQEGGGRAIGLGSVVNEMVSDQSLLPLSSFLSSTASIFSVPSIPFRIASTLIVSPLWWGLQQLNIVASDEYVQSSTASRWSKAQGKYVVKSTLEKAASNIISHFQTLPHSSITDMLFSTTSFRSTFASKALPGVSLSNNEIDVVLKFLERDRKVLLREGHVIKFDPFTTSSIPPISSVDHGVLEMSTTLLALQTQISELEMKISDQSNKLSYSLKNNQKPTALSHLRSRKTYEDLLAKRLGSMEIVQNVLIKVETAAGDIEILKAYETSTATLVTLLSSPSLQRAHIDLTMDNMADALADHAEIEAVLVSGGEAARNAADPDAALIEEAELKAELDSMVREAEKEEAEARERVALAEKERSERLEKEETEARERIEAAEKERLELEEGEEREARDRVGKLEEERVRAERKAEMEKREKEKSAEVAVIEEEDEGESEEVDLKGEKEEEKREKVLAE